MLAKEFVNQLIFHLRRIWVGHLLLIITFPVYGGIDKCGGAHSTLSSAWRAQSPTRSGLTANELVKHASTALGKVPEFEYLRVEAAKMGIRVWLFGGTAASFLHYAKWDLAREKGLLNLQKDRFDYDFTNIFRSTQDLDIVVDGTVEKAREFQIRIAQRYPHFLGGKAAKWEVRTLRQQMGDVGQPGFKEALLNDLDFSHQNTDSNSVGMVEITKGGEPIVRDLRQWESVHSQFLDDVLNNRISYYRSQHHFNTSRARAGENPEILSVVRLLVKAFQYELNFSEEDLRKMKEVADRFDPKMVTNANALRRIQDTAKKLVQHAVNLEYAVNMLDQLGLRQKLKRLGNENEFDSHSWWLNKEPLRSKEVGKGWGNTAEKLGIDVVAHETNNFLAYESITRAHSGEPNVFISRQGAVGESASHGDGFYTRLGRAGARGTGLTIRFKVDPKAREGVDFIRSGDVIVFKNKKALKVIQESLDIGIEDLLKLAEESKEISVDRTDLGLLEKVKRRLNAARINDEFEKLLRSPNQKDHERLINILSSFQNENYVKLLNKEVLNRVITSVFRQVAPHSSGPDELDMIRYIKTVAPILRMLDEMGELKTWQFANYVNDVLHSDRSFSLKKEALFETLLSSIDFTDSLHRLMKLSLSERNELVSEMKQWQKSLDLRKKKFVIDLENRWANAIESGDTALLQVILESGIIDINRFSTSGFSALHMANYYRQEKVVEWIIGNPDFDFNRKNSRGNTVIEELRLLGEGRLADRLRHIVKDKIQERELGEVKERNTDGTPIVDFVKIRGGSFLMGNNEKKVPVTLTSPFELMSIPTTQEIWKSVVEMLTEKTVWASVVDVLKFRPASKYNRLKKEPASVRGSSNPVDEVSFDHVKMWIDGLNELSSKDDLEIQKRLESLFPGHKKGDLYRLPTEAEYEFVSRSAGLAEAGYAYRFSEKELSERAWYKGNSGLRTNPVGLRKPIILDGKPIYDLHGNVRVWVSDWYAHELTGGTDPKGPPSSWARVLCGGSSYDYPHVFFSALRKNWPPTQPLQGVGFRLARVR